MVGWDCMSQSDCAQPLRSLICGRVRVVRLRIRFLRPAPYAELHRCERSHGIRAVSRDRISLAWPQLNALADFPSHCWTLFAYSTSQKFIDSAFMWNNGGSCKTLRQRGFFSIQGSSSGTGRSSIWYHEPYFRRRIDWPCISMCPPAPKTLLPSSGLGVYAFTRALQSKSHVHAELQIPNWTTNGTPVTAPRRFQASHGLTVFMDPEPLPHWTVWQPAPASKRLLVLAPQPGWSGTGAPFPMVAMD